MLFKQTASAPSLLFEWLRLVTVAFNLAVTHGGVHINQGEEVLKLVFNSGLRWWKKRFARVLNNCHDGIYPSSLEFLALIVVSVPALRLPCNFDTSFGFNRLHWQPSSIAFHQSQTEETTHSIGMQLDSMSHSLGISLVCQSYAHSLPVEDLSHVQRMDVWVSRSFRWILIFVPFHVLCKFKNHSSINENHLELRNRGEKAPLIVLRPNH